MQVDFKLDVVTPIENITPDTDFVIVVEHTDTAINYNFGFDVALCRVAENGLDPVSDRLDVYIIKDAEQIIHRWFADKGVASTDYTMSAAPNIIFDVVQRKLNELGDNATFEQSFESRNEVNQSKDLPFGKISIATSSNGRLPLGDYTFVAIDDGNALMHGIGVNFYPDQKIKNPDYIVHLPTMARLIVDGVHSLIGDWSQSKSIESISYVLDETKLQQAIQQVLEVNGVPNEQAELLPENIETAFGTIKFVEPPSDENIKTFDDFPDRCVIGVNPATGKIRRLYVKVVPKPMMTQHDHPRVVQILAAVLEETFDKLGLEAPMPDRSMHNSQVVTRQSIADFSTQYFMGMANDLRNIGYGAELYMPAGQFNPKDRTPAMNVFTSTREREEGGNPHRWDALEGPARLCLSVMNQGWHFVIRYSDEKTNKQRNDLHGSVTFRGEKRLFSFGSGSPVMKAEYLRYLPEEFVRNFICESIAQTLAVYGMAELIDLATLEFFEVPLTIEERSVLMNLTNNTQTK